jgi:O-antigen ligase
MMHFFAMSGLEQFTYITGERQNAKWGLGILKEITLVYLLFPLLLFVAIDILKDNPQSYKLLYKLPIFIIPSLALALYQALFDINFFRVSGFDNDVNGFGLSLLLLLPMCVLGIFVIRSFWTRLLFIVLTLTLILCLFLSGSRTGIAGMIFFIMLFPWVWNWSGNGFLKKRRYAMYSGSIVIVFLTILTIGIFFPKHCSLLPNMLKRWVSVDNNCRAIGIKNTFVGSGRLELGLQGYRLTKLSPLSGWGPGGFYRNLYNIRFRNGRTHGLPFDNANNHYLQISSELGLLGAFLNVVLHILPLWMIFRIRGKIKDQDEKLAVGITFITVIIMLLLFFTGPHTMAISVSWIFVFLLAFLYSISFKYNYYFKKLNVKLLSYILICLTVVFSWGNYLNVFGSEGYKSRQKAEWWPFKYENNCYPEGDLERGAARWCKKDAVLQVPISRLPDKVKLTFVVYHPDIQSKPVIVRYGGMSGPAHEITVKDKKWNTVEIPVTEDYLLRSKKHGRYFVLSLDVSSTWVPKEWGISEDKRELGVLVLTSQLEKQLTC